MFFVSLNPRCISNLVIKCFSNKLQFSIIEPQSTVISGLKMTRCEINPSAIRKPKSRHVFSEILEKSQRPSMRKNSFKYYISWKNLPIFCVKKIYYASNSGKSDFFLNLRLSICLRFAPAMPVWLRFNCRSLMLPLHS